MTLAQARVLLRRRLQEVVADQWSDAELTTLINAALGRMQTLLMRVDPDAFVSIYTKDTAAAQPYYENPPAMLTLLTLEQKITASSDYTKVKPKKRVDILSRVSGDSDLWYARLGRTNIQLSPTPTAAVASGLRFTFVNTLTVADDSDVFGLPFPLHMGIVYWAEVMAIGEGRQSAKDTKDELTAMINDIPSWYLQSGDENPTLDIDLSKNFLE
jgi:hypothetical protein